MLQHVFSAFDAVGADPEVTFCDICHTPVDLARWYADTVSKSLETQASDILTFEARESYDIICTHSFLGYFTDADRKSLAAKWRELLRPGGKVVTINRIRPDHEGDVVKFSSAQARAFQGKARAEIEKHRQDLDIGPEELARGVCRYVRHFQVHPVRSLGDLENLFQDNGFDVDRLDVKTVPGNENRPGAGPTTPEGAAYAHLVATRR